ncbi:gp436 family protein [Moritella viscosa]|uniref:DUF1320 domain-containing protein n=1 Tax=Moritella viscosa TaxID=80854 RepID=A0ABY1HAR4_9GAMM|nr:DUF1320 domain-containing protein [Moritella viscosa]CED61141.1 bacteriophage Mu-like gp36 protein [Moritella viscosa]SGY85093.1 Putative uncharacterized protein [Moritella viscosa]SGY87279.1 Putative uncharacterized protein [Moritella viscosa]SHN99437.1 Putative uncharacterized protein [Moritella viscosa]SHO20108.1 Putative uncharacterized protein [Moritella viscosa]
MTVISPVVYATKQDLLERDASFVWTVATAADGETLDDVAITSALNDAADEVNSFLTRYQLPLAQVPRLINRLTLSIAFYWLADRDSNISTLIQQRYDNAIVTLKDVKAGRRDLGLPTVSKPTENTSGKVEVIAPYRPSMRASIGDIL